MIVLLNKHHFNSSPKGMIVVSYRYYKWCTIELRSTCVRESLNKKKKRIVYS